MSESSHIRSPVAGDKPLNRWRSGSYKQFNASEKQYDAGT